MAAPTYGASGTSFSGSGASVAIAAPSGVVADSVVVACFFLDGATDQNVVPPAGWTAAENSPVAASNHRMYVFWHRATGSESGPYTFTWDASQYREGQAHRFDGVTTSGTPFDSGTNTAVDNTSGTTTPSVTITTAGADRLLIHCASDWSGGTWTAPTGFTKRQQPSVGLATLSDKAQASAGSSGSVQATSSASDKRTAFLGGLIPTAATTPIAQTTETDTANALTPSKSRAVGQPTETDTANAVTPAKTGAMGQVTESDTAQSVTPGKSVAIGMVTETNTANGWGHARSLAIGQAIEQDTANGIATGATKLVPIGQVTETTTANPLTAQMLGPWELIQPTITVRHVHDGLRFPHVISLTVFGNDTDLVAKELPNATELVGLKYVFYGGHFYTTSDPALKALWLSKGWAVHSV